MHGDVAKILLEDGAGFEQTLEEETKISVRSVNGDSPQEESSL